MDNVKLILSASTLATLFLAAIILTFSPSKKIQKSTEIYHRSDVGAKTYFITNIDNELATFDNRHKISQDKITDGTYAMIVNRTPYKLSEQLRNCQNQELQKRFAQMESVMMPKLQLFDALRFQLRFLGSAYSHEQLKQQVNKLQVALDDFMIIADDQIELVMNLQPENKTLLKLANLRRQFLKLFQDDLNVYKLKLNVVDLKDFIINYASDITA